MNENQKRSQLPVKLKELRKAGNLTQGEIAQKLYISRSCWSNYETGDRHPSTEMLSKIAESFNVGVEYLMGDDLPDDMLEFIEKKASAHKLMQKYGGLDLSPLSSVKRVILIEFYKFLRADTGEKAKGDI